MPAPPNGNGLWKTIALALMTGVIGWFTHAALDAGGPATIVQRGRSGGETPSGWSVEQASKFIKMPEQLDSVLIREAAIMRLLRHRYR